MHVRHQGLPHAIFTLLQLTLPIEVDANAIPCFLEFGDRRSGCFLIRKSGDGNSQRGAAQYRTIVDGGPRLFVYKFDLTPP